MTFSSFWGNIFAVGEFMKIKILADSTADLTKEICEKFDIEQLPLTVSLGENDYFDGVTINPQMIYDYVKQTNQLPKTSAINQMTYEHAYQKVFDEGYNGIVHFTISSEMSTCYNNAVAASKQFENVAVVDSRTLSTGIALLAMYASELAKQGKFSAQEIAKKAEARIPFDQTSFVVDKLNYLYKGGRCSAVSLFGANLLKIKPSIVVKTGNMGVDKKYFGNLEKVLIKYIQDTLQKYSNPDYTRIFVTHTQLDKQIVDKVVDYLKQNTQFKEIWETTAGSTVTSHCGSHTLGILYLNDGDKI